MDTSLKPDPRIPPGPPRASGHSRTATETTEMAVRSLLRVIGLFRQIMEPYFASFGISGAQWGILRILHRAESKGQHGLALKELGERLLIQPPSVTGVVDRLERMDLVRRNGSKTDLRVREVSLTPAGHTLVGKVLQAHSSKIRSLFEVFEHDELHHFAGLLSKMERHLGSLAGGHPDRAGNL